ncbi:MAG: hypothetical protein JRH19_12820 [Deltaproteobacteria bacterium]|nr:hypothetical protein [Deltaproteobacteria bacterium]
MSNLLKKTLAALLAVAVGVVLLEFGSLLLFERLTGASFDRSRLGEERGQRIEALLGEFAEGGEEEAAGSLYRFHPYLGFVGTPGGRPWAMGPALLRETAFNAFGMASRYAHPYPYRKRNDELVVAVLGGSVAEIFANSAQEQLRDALAELDPRFASRRVVLLSLATGGFKQPQQLFVLQYALLLGFEIDVVLNIDGFNDLVFAVENAGDGIHPLFPSGFHTGLIGKSPTSRFDLATLGLFASVHRASTRELRVLAFAQGAPQRYSVFFNLLAERLSRGYEGERGRARYELARLAQEGVAEEFRGPPFAPGADPAQEAARLWRRSSELIDAVCRAAGIPYVHVLQPNQYVEGSKQLSEQELRVAWRPETYLARTTRRGYGGLRREGRVLAQAGVSFYDFTMIFEDRSGDIYVDSCCHFGPRGNGILARELAPILLRKLAPSAEPLSRDRRP